MEQKHGRTHIAQCNVIDACFIPRSNVFLAGRLRSFYPLRHRIGAAQPQGNCHEARGQGSWKGFRGYVTRVFELYNAVDEVVPTQV